MQISPTEEQKEALRQTCELYINICNYVSGYIYVTHCTDYYQLNHDLYHKIREEFGSKSQMTQSAIKTTVTAYKSLMENNQKWTKPNFRHLQYDMVWNHDYSFVSGMLSLGIAEGRIKVPFFGDHMEKFFSNSHNPLPEHFTEDYTKIRKTLTASSESIKNLTPETADIYAPVNGWKFGTAKLVVKHKKWYLHVAVTGEFNKPVNIDQIVGIDMGINFLAVTFDSNGKTTFYNGRFIKNIRARYKATRQSLQKRGTPSARRRLKAIGSRENGWMEDVNHCLSKALVNAYPSNTLFVVEDLTGIRSATARVRKRDRYIQVSWAYQSLQSKIEYKAKMHGSMMAKVDPHYTSQCCPVCGHTEKNNRDRSTHTFKCKHCGYTTNDDRVAAINIMKKGNSAAVCSR